MAEGGCCSLSLDVGECVIREERYKEKRINEREVQ
jgi:hypothetical protein